MQIAFNVLPASQKKMFDKLPGVPPKFTTYADTDYDYALNAVAPQFGGGTEIWRLRSPQLPEKHYTQCATLFHAQMSGFDAVFVFGVRP